jgi:hypothetical protein
MVGHQRPGEAFGAGVDQGCLQTAAMETPLRVCVFYLSNKIPAPQSTGINSSHLTFTSCCL